MRTTSDYWNRANRLFLCRAFANPAHLVRSGILFGPPGTGKTTFAQCTANYLGWPFLELDPAHFAADGLDRVPELVTHIFRYLMELEDTVILFDEMDELVRSHDSSGSDTSWIQRIWTTSFLPKVQRSARQGESRVLYSDEQFYDA